MRNYRACGIILAAIVIVTMSGSLTAVRAEDWPTRPITFIVPFSAGGSADTMARGVASFLGTELDVAIKVIDRPGAAGMVGTTAFLNTKDDGYTVFVGTQPYITNSIIFQGAKYKLEDLDFINIEQIDPCTVSVHADSRFKKLSDLIDAIKAKPGEISFGTIIGGSPYLAYSILSDKLNLNVRVVTYQGGGPFRTALLGRHVDFVIGTAAGDLVMKPNARVIAIFDERPFKGWPEAELVNEALKPYGVKMPNIASVRFVAVHSSFKAKHPDRYQKLVETYKKMFHSKGYQKFIKKIGNKPVSRWMGPEKANAYMKKFHELTVKYKDRIRPPKKK
ncbi:MAG: tripartite tricarboxylate transporter substrate binding protein [Deltaproteobacteria bacterium]|nr:tripartite tricarboxylate transporter substrate binding protein [Deltaproteobacteria bacterium]